MAQKKKKTTTRRITKPKTSSGATGQISITIGKPLADAVEKEATLVNMNRSQFLRTVIARQQGTVFLSRNPQLPPFKLPSKRKHPLVTIQLSIQPDLLKFLHEFANQCGNISRSAVVAFLILKWFEIDPFSPPVAA